MYPKDRVAVLFASTTKTVVLGVPMLRVIYANRSPGEQAVLLLPLIMYHMLELINGLVMSSKIHAWLQTQKAPEEQSLVAATKSKKVYDATTV